MDDPDEMELVSPVAETTDPAVNVIGAEECGITDVIHSDLTGSQLVTVYDLNIQTPADLSLDSVGTLPYDAITTHDLPVEPPTEKDAEGPEVVAVETVVTTTKATKYKVKSIKTHNIGSGDVERVELSDDTELPALPVKDVDSFSFPTGEINWSDPQIMDKVLVTGNPSLNENGEQLDLAVAPCSVTDVASQPQWFIALVPDTNGEVVTIPQQVLPQAPSSEKQSLSDIRKREKDREKKRELRQDPSFRCKEKEQARLRMRLKRNDPEYREKEREKDRLRRRQARSKNTGVREKERDRDRNYKRLQRTVFPINFVPKVDIDNMPYSEVDSGDETGLNVTDDQNLDVC